jgi:hypothetical protein
LDPARIAPPKLLLVTLLFRKVLWSTEIEVTRGTEGVRKFSMAPPPAVEVLESKVQ